MDRRLGFFETPAKRAYTLSDDLSDVVIVLDCDGVLAQWPGGRVLGSKLFQDMLALLQSNQQAEALQLWHAASDSTHTLHGEYEGIRFREEAIEFLHEMLRRKANIGIVSSNYTDWLMFQVAQAQLKPYLANQLLTVSGTEQIAEHGKGHIAKAMVEHYRASHGGQSPAVVAGVDDDHTNTHDIKESLEEAGIKHPIIETPDPGQIDFEDIKRQIGGRIEEQQRSPRSTPSPPHLS